MKHKGEAHEVVEDTSFTLKVSRVNRKAVTGVSEGLFGYATSET